MNSSRTKARSFPRPSSRYSPRRSSIAPKPEQPGVLVIFGPTGVGKSEAIRKVLDSRFEVINADSMQAYRGMDIGTAKPSPDELSAVPHHLLSILEPSAQYSAGEFVKRAELLVSEIRARGKLPVVSGGTAFYIRCFLFGLPESPAGEVGLRAEMRGREKEMGIEALYEALERRDPEAAARIPPNDRNRIIRALEILESSGRSMYSFCWPRTLRKDYRFTILGLTRPRDELYERINTRVRGMFAAGLVGEVRALMESGFTADDPGMKGIGYREFFLMRMGCMGFPEVRELIAQDSRRYAKRQITFFRTVPEVQWIDAGDLGAVEDRVGAHAAAGGSGA